MFVPLVTGVCRHPPEHKDFLGLNSQPQNYSGISSEEVSLKEHSFSTPEHKIQLLGVEQVPDQNLTRGFEICHTLPLTRWFDVWTRPVWIMFDIENLQIEAKRLLKVGTIQSFLLNMVRKVVARSISIELIYK